MLLTDNVSYTEHWLRWAREELQKKPESHLHHFTHINYSGGQSGWEDWIHQIYFKPKTLEERFLQMQVHEILLVALENAFRRAEEKKCNGTWRAWDGMELAEAFRMSQRVVQIDPLTACTSKVRLNRIARRMGTSLEALAERNFDLLIGGIGMNW